MTDGSIVRLKVQQFMTYDFLEFTPDLHLNLITGPNGSGKSSLLCAMCLGLGGKPSHIGRSDKLSDFVKIGYNEGYIEIELLVSEGPNLVVGRWITLSNTSRWTLNGKTSSQKQVEKAVAKYNIQTTNLCQFLPQEKVSEFAKMNQKELLESTEQAVGDQSMYDNHIKLKEMSSHYAELENKLCNGQAHLDREIEKNKRLEGEIKQHKEREIVMENIKNIEKKIPFVKWEKAKENLRVMEQNKNEAQNNLKACKLALKPLHDEIAKIDRQALEEMKQIKFVDNKIKNKYNDIARITQELAHIDTKVSDAKYEMEQNIKEEMDREEKLQNSRTYLRNLEMELLEGQEEDENDEKHMEEIVEQYKVAQSKFYEFNDAKQQSLLKQNQLNQKLAEIQNQLQRRQHETNNRIDILRRKEPDVYKAICWLRENSHLFQKKIYEPILTLINVHDQRCVKYIEHSIPYRDLIAFYAEDPKDMNLFLHELSDKQHLNVSGLHAVALTDQQLRPNMSASALRELGLNDYIKDLFTAPTPVMHYLCRNYHLQNVPVGYKRDSNSLRNIKGNPKVPFKKFYLGDFSYRLKTSKYGDRVQSSTSLKIAENGLLRGSVDSTEISKLQNESKEVEIIVTKEKCSFQKISLSREKFIAEMEQLKVRKKEILDKRSSRKVLIARINSQKENVRVAETPYCNIKQEEQKLAQTIAKSFLAKLQIQGKIGALFEEILALEKEKSRKCFSHYFLLKKKETIATNLRTASEELNTYEQVLEVSTNNLHRSRSELHTFKAQLMNAIGLRQSDEISPQFLGALKKDFEGLPDEVIELGQVLATEQTKLSCMCQSNPAVIKEFSDREKIIKESMQKLLTHEKDMEKMKHDIDAVKDKWLPAIEHLIGQINVNFGRYFASLGCVGEVSLDKSDNPNDFQKYGVSIKVQFRDNEPLNQLSHAHHSGGECSVSTMLYILSLQELTEVPFRCVDEINQGMDIANERRVFELIAESSCNKNKSQYFLITPKLLFALSYTEEMLIAIICSGMAKSTWDAQDFLEKL